MHAVQLLADPMNEHDGNTNETQEDTHTHTRMHERGKDKNEKGR